METERRFERKYSREKCTEDKDYSNRKRRGASQEESKNGKARDDNRNNKIIDNGKRIIKKCDVKQEKHSPYKDSDCSHRPSSKRKRDDIYGGRKNTREWDKGKTDTADIDSFRYNFWDAKLNSFVNSCSKGK